jgi:hypothetical protein
VAIAIYPCSNYGASKQSFFYVYLSRGVSPSVAPFRHSPPIIFPTPYHDGKFYRGTGKIRRRSKGERYTYRKGTMRDRDVNKKQKVKQNHVRIAGILIKCVGKCTGHP